MKLRVLITILITFFIGIIACKDNNTDTNAGCNADFDQKLLFANVADNIIIPVYESLQSELDLLESKVEAFLASPSSGSLLETQAAFKAAYLKWQKAAQYEFGPAESNFLINSFNNFPVNVGQLETSISTGNHHFDIYDTYDKGFPALDYLLFGLGDDSETITTAFNDVEDNENRRAYLVLLIEDMQTRLTQTLTDWKGNYKYDFVENTGTADGSSLSLLVNGFNKNYELIKRDRIGIPSGVYTLNIPNPEKVEAFYSQISLELAMESIKATQQFYTGITEDGFDGVGLDDYLKEINAQKNSQSLDEIIKAQFELIVQKLNLLETPLSNAVGTDDTTPALQAVYNELSKQVVNVKTDLPANLCVSITYVDNPSDSD